MTNLIRLFQAPPKQLHVAPDGSWFRVGDGERKSLAKHHSMRRILSTLVTMLQADPEACMTVPEAFEAGWPGERALPKAASTRVYTAVHKLRKMGLEGILVMRAGSYILEADLHIMSESMAIPVIAKPVEVLVAVS